MRDARLARVLPTFTVLLARKTQPILCFTLCLGQLCAMKHVLLVSTQMTLCSNVSSAIPTAKHVLKLPKTAPPVT